MPAIATQETDLSSLLDDGLAAMALPLDTATCGKLLAYVTLLGKWNQVYNLTAIREPARMIGAHILDSLSVVPHLPARGALLDIGSGGGLPGIPIAAARPDLHVTMLDSVQKKTTFVRQAIGELGLTNAEVVNERIEKYQPQQSFNVIISRAYAELADFVAGAAPLLAEGGHMLAMKGVYPHEEIARLPKEFVVNEVCELSVPQIEGKRHLVKVSRA